LDFLPYRPAWVRSIPAPARLGIHLVYDRNHYICKRGDKYAFGAACAVKVAFAFEWFNLQFNAHSQVSYAWLQGVIWIAFAMTVFLISTWPERSRTRFHPLPPPPSELINKAGDGE
jgi:hypothetical protein